MSLRNALLAGTAFVFASAPAFADDAAILKRLDALQHMMELQQKQIAAQRGEITALKSALHRKGVKVPPVEAETAEATPPQPVPELSDACRAAASGDQHLVNKFAALEDRTRVEKADLPVWSIAGGRRA